MSAIRQFFARVRSAGRQRPQPVTTVSMGRERTFDAYDVGSDTFVFERGVLGHLDEKPSVLVAAKGDLGRRGRGMVLTVSTGNHSVAAFPLLDGRFWRLSSLPPSERSATLTRAVLCANIVNDKLEISQRDVPTATLAGADGWLCGAAGFALGDVTMLDRNAETLAHYRRLGMEWRIKPLAWTEGEIRLALEASRKRIATKLVYYHSGRGVHFLTLSEFNRFAELAKTDYDGFVAALRELVAVFEGNRVSYMRLAKYSSHHEIELFGLAYGSGLRIVVPELEKLLEAITLGRIDHAGAAERIASIAVVYESQLTRRAFADDGNPETESALYMHVTGEIYSVVGDGLTPTFDDRRLALPGATFERGRAALHPGADARTEVLLANLRGMMSKDELIEYANVYELRGSDDGEAVGNRSTREIVYKTNRRPVENALVEKRLASSAPGYAAYLLSRIGALRALGVELSDYYRLLQRRSEAGGRAMDHYIRRRCEGEPLELIPASYYRSGRGGDGEEKAFVLALVMLMGDAAAQNLVMKKYDAKTESPLFGIGKEIYDIGRDLTLGRMMPRKVSTCSVRGSFGWPNLERSERNLREIAAFYFGHYAKCLRDFVAVHPSVALAEASERFRDGFRYRIRAMSWNLATHREEFETFAPELPARYGFAGKWRFILWSLGEHERRLDELRNLI